jgi:hypothetical protein
MVAQRCVAPTHLWQRPAVAPTHRSQPVAAARKLADDEIFLMRLVTGL